MAYATSATVRGPCVGARGARARRLLHAQQMRPGSRGIDALAASTRVSYQSLLNVTGYCLSPPRRPLIHLQAASTSCWTGTGRVRPPPPACVLEARRVQRDGAHAAGAPRAAPERRQAQAPLLTPAGAPRPRPRPPGAFRLAALQSPAGRALLSRCGRAPDDISSIVLVELDPAAPSGARGHIKSEAVRRISARLGLPFPVLAALAQPVPLPLRDLLYDQVAANRYSFFGRTDACRLGDAGAYASRFVVE
jgi:predicted DCC family thiol-disulfide oxidoreductase YuxK